MKKLNRKGFTLVELLAVIIILAIVVGITIPAVMTTTGKARKTSFTTAANAAADWFERQYQAYLIGDKTMSPVDAQFTAACVTKSCISTNGLTGSALTANMIVAAGLKSKNIVAVTTSASTTMTTTLASNTTTSYVMINSSTNRACVKLVSTSNGDYPATKVECGGVCSDTQCKSSNT